MKIEINPNFLKEYSEYLEQRKKENPRGVYFIR